MPKVNQAGAAQLLVPILLVVGIVATVYLAGQTQIFKPKASPSIGPENGFYLVEQPKFRIPKCPIKALSENFNFICPEYDPNPNVLVVKLYGRSDTESSNLFAANINFPKDILEVQYMYINTALEEDGGKICNSVITRACLPTKCSADLACPAVIECKDFPSPCTVPDGWIIENPGRNIVLNTGGGTATKSIPEESLIKEGEIIIDDSGLSQPYLPGFIKNIVDQSFDNKEGTISIAGGVPNPGYKTEMGQPLPVMAVVVFTIKKEGQGKISFNDSSAIYSNSTNENIITANGDIDIDTSKPRETVTTCKGEITLEKLKTELQGANYPGPWDTNSMVVAYNKAACPGPVTTCKGELSFEQLTKELKGANYPGPWEVKAMVEAYDRAACPKPPVTTCKGELSFSDLTVELQAANYPGPWDTESMVAAYNRAACPQNSGDLNGDKKTNLVDASVFFSKCTGEKVFNQPSSVAPVCDLNGDGKINAFDLGTLVKVLISNKVIKGINELPPTPLQ